MSELWTWVSDHLAAIVALLAVVSSVLNRKKLSKMEINIDGRFSELLEAHGARERAKGVIEGRQLSVDETHSRVIESERVEDRAEHKTRESERK